MRLYANLCVCQLAQAKYDEMCNPEQQWLTVQAYARPAMRTSPHPPAVRSAAGNGEERAAQITHIQDRLDSIRGVHEHIGTEIAGLTEDVKQLNSNEPPPAAPIPDKDPS